MDNLNKRNELIKYGVELIHNGLVIATWGNLSIRIDNDSYIITPSGKPYTQLSPGDLVHMKIDGTIIDDRNKPSSEHLLHSNIYKNRSDVNGIVHTHSDNALAFAITGQSIPVVLEEMAQLIGGSIDVADYALPGTTQLAENVVKTLGDKTACIMASHGAVAVGRNLSEAYTTALLIDKAAKVVLNGMKLGKINIISDNDIRFMREFYLNKYNKIGD